MFAFGLSWTFLNYLGFRGGSLEVEEGIFDDTDIFPPVLKPIIKFSRPLSFSKFTACKN